MSQGTFPGSRDLESAAGLNDGTYIRRGKAIIPATETTASASFTLMPTPDRVQNVTLSTDGLIVIGYQATWQGSAGGGNALGAIFIGANQVVATQTAGVPTVQQTVPGGGVVASDCSLSSSVIGLISMDNHAYPGDATTGQILAAQSTNGGPCYVFAAAGTYDVSIQFKALSGTVTAKNRKLWVWTLGF